MGWLKYGLAALVSSQLAQALVQRDAQREQTKAMQDMRDEDARKTAEAETNAAVAANAQLADNKRRRRASSLGEGDTSTDSTTLGGPTSTLAGGAAASRAATAAASYYSAPAASYSGSALGAGASAAVTRGSTNRQAAY